MTTNDTLTRPATGEPAAGRGPDRSPVLNEARLNLFRVLRLPVGAGADDAIWKAEELLTLLRAGLPPTDPDPAPWLPPAGEAEVRQAVQAAEEPLRRLIARLCWFDFDAKADGELLRRAVATLAPAEVNAYFHAKPEVSDPKPPPKPKPRKPEPPPATSAEAKEDFSASLQRVAAGLGKPAENAPPPEESQSPEDFWASVTGPPAGASGQRTEAVGDVFDQPQSNGAPPAPAPDPAATAPTDNGQAEGEAAADDWMADAPAAPPSSAYRATIRRLNEANLLLLLAGRATNDAAPQPTDGPAAGWDWTEADGVRVAVNPHTSGPVADGAPAGRLRAADLWDQALKRWADLLGKPRFLDFLRACLTELNDEIVGPDDAESVVNTLWTRLTDLLAGEVRAQLGEGRTDRAAALLKVAAESEVEARRWVLALRSLRPRFKAEVSELEPLIARDVAALDDLELYIGRVHGLAKRWAALDPGGVLALGEITDEAVGRAVGQLINCQEYPTAERVRGLLQMAEGAAVSESVKSKAAAAGKQLEDLKEYACHFCQQRDLDVNTWVVLSGKKETGRTYSGNTTTIHYLIKKAIIPRCARCAELHEYLRWVGIWTWLALLPVVLLLVYWLVVEPATNPYGRGSYSAARNDGLPGWVVLVGLAVGYILSGFLARVLVAGSVTPHGERRYSDVSGSKGHRGLAKEGFTITLDYSKNAYKNLTKSG